MRSRGLPLRTDYHCSRQKKVRNRSLSLWRNREVCDRENDTKLFIVRIKSEAMVYMEMKWSYSFVDQGHCYKTSTSDHHNTNGVDSTAVRTISTKCAVLGTQVAHLLVINAILKSGSQPFEIWVSVQITSRKGLLGCRPLVRLVRVGFQPLVGVGHCNITTAGTPVDVHMFGTPR
jgi:hypothetical protein